MSSLWKEKPLSLVHSSLDDLFQKLLLLMSRWGISSIGRVRALQARGTGIETRILHVWSYSVMVITLDFESSDPGSNPGRTSFYLLQVLFQVDSAHWRSWTPWSGDSSKVAHHIFTPLGIELEPQTGCEKSKKIQHLVLFFQEQSPSGWQTKKRSGHYRAWTGDPWLIRPMLYQLS